MSKAASKNKLRGILLVVIFALSFLNLTLNVNPASALVVDIVQQKRETLPASTQFVNVTLDAAPTEGNALLLAFGQTRSSSPITPESKVNSTGVTWIKLTGTTAGTFVGVEIFFGIVGAGAGTEIKVDSLFGGGPAYGGLIDIIEVSGINMTDYDAGSTSNVATTTTTGNTGVLTVTDSPILLFGAVYAGYASGANDQSDATNQFTLVNGTSILINTKYQSLASVYLESYATGDYSCQTTIANSSNVEGAVAALKIAATSDYSYEFKGVYDENINADQLVGAANLTAFFDDGTAPFTFTLNNSAIYTPLTKPLYFYYDIWQYSNTSDTSLHREYWLGANEDNGTYYVYANNYGLENIVFTIRALGGAGLGSYVNVQRNIGGTLQTVEKRPVDSTGAVVMSLQAFTLYTVSIEGTEPNTSTTFGNINTYTTPIVLTVSALSFPSSTLQQYKYLAIWASRPTSTDIMVNYNDTNLQTVSVYYEISDANGTVHYNFTHTGENSFSDIWTSALANTTYYLEATVVQSVFGTTVFKQILAKDGTTASPIDLSFLGTWEFSIYGVTVSLEASQVFWALVVLIIFGSFSVLNAYMGAFAGVAAAAVFVGLGWLDIPAGAVALAFAFTVVIGIAVYKRRGN